MQAPGAQAAQPNATLLRLLAHAHPLQHVMLSHPENGLAALTKQTSMTGTYITRLLRLCWLAPDIIQAILDGGQPRSLTSTALMRKIVNLPVEWPAQRSALGFLPT